MSHEDFIQRFPERGEHADLPHLRRHLDAMVEAGQMERRGTGANAQYRPSEDAGRSSRRWLTAEQIGRHV